MHILVVAREARLRALVVAGFAGFGHVPVPVASAEAALRLVLEEFPWDAAVAGWDADPAPGERTYLRALAARVPLVLAARPGEHTARLAEAYGPALVVAGPEDVEDLCRLVELVGTSFAH
jgi:hypothetical protein